MIRTAALFSIALGILLTSFPRGAEAHMPPPAYMNLKITDEQTEQLRALGYVD